MKHSYIIFSILFFSLLGGCKKFVTVGAPYTLTSTQDVFNDPISATSAQTGIYLQMQSTQLPYLLARETGAYGDELQNFSTDAGSVALYKDGLNSNNIISSIWSSSFNELYACNTELEGLQQTKALTPAVQSQLTGEAKFTRAFLYFNLVNLYGNLPLITLSDYTKNQQAANVSSSAIYTQIRSDLTDAVSILDSNFLDGSSSLVTQERIRPTKWAAMALLARVELYTGDFAQAETMSANVIANNAMFSLNDLSDVFLKNSNESIWQLQNTSQIFYDMVGFNFVLDYAINTLGEANSSVISPQLLAAFEPGDNRQTSWLGTYTDALSGNVYYFPYKYKEGYTSDPTEYTSVLRLAEQYLIRAECYAQRGDVADAVADLNVIRNRAGLTAYAGATDKSSLLTAILHERQVELFAEWGHRWFDLKRTGNADAVMNIVAPAKGGTWASFRQLWPIMQTNITRDGNLTQNPGY